MSNEIRRYDSQERDYWLLSDGSKAANKYVLGDNSGRSISLRKGHGLKKVLNLDISDDNAVHLVHVGIATSLILLKSKDSGKKVLGGFLGLALFGLYQAGRQDDDELLIY